VFFVNEYGIEVFPSDANIEQYTDNATGITTATLYITAPPTAVGADVVGVVQNCASGETHYIGNMIWETMPGVGVAASSTSRPYTVNGNLTNLAGTGVLNINRGCITNGRLYLPAMSVNATPMLPLPGYIIDVELGELL
jgi:hypothetical protein